MQEPGFPSGDERPKVYRSSRDSAGFLVGDSAFEKKIVEVFVKGEILKYVQIKQIWHHLTLAQLHLDQVFKSWGSAWAHENFLQRQH